MSDTPPEGPGSPNDDPDTTRIDAIPPVPGEDPGPGEPVAMTETDTVAAGDDEEPVPWYQNPKILAALGVGVLLLGLVIGWLVFGGDDDEKDAASSTASTTTEVTTTTTPTTVPATTAAPVTTAAPAPPAPTPDPAQGQLDAARSSWAGQNGRSYVFSYTQESEGLNGRLCVSGIAGDPGSVVDVTGPCGPDVQSGGMGVEAWFDTIQQSIDDGILASASYHPDGYPTFVDIQPPEADRAVMNLDFFDYPEG